MSKNVYDVKLFHFDNSFISSYCIRSPQGTLSKGIFEPDSTHGSARGRAGRNCVPSSTGLLGCGGLVKFRSGALARLLRASACNCTISFAKSISAVEKTKGFNTKRAAGKVR
jgi:hypothetical protein